MPSKTSEYFPRPEAYIVSFAHGKRVSMGPTNLAHNFIVLQDAPRNVHAVIVPVRPWHLLVDICIYTRHFAAGLLGKAQRKADRSRGKKRKIRIGVVVSRTVAQGDLDRGVVRRRELGDTIDHPAIRFVRWARADVLN